MNYKFEIKISGDGDGIHFSYDGSSKELVVATEIMAAKILANAAKDKRNLDSLLCFRSLLLYIDIFLEL